jgi:hypothetical protein
MSLVTTSAQLSPHAPPEPSPGESPLVAWFARRMPSWGGVALLLLAGVVIFWPALRAEFALDDHAHAAMVAGTFPAPRAPYDLYNLIDDTSRGPLLERGVLPWWTRPELTIRFFRPLSSVLRWADYKLLGDRPFAHHAHSFLWWIALVFAARALFRRLLPSRPAAIATFIFALAPCQSVPLIWLANREALVSLALGLPGLLAYVRWREERAWRYAVLSALCFAGSLAGGEYALAFTGYVLAFELFRRGEGLGRRLLGGWPFALPAAAYLALRTALGYGAAGSGFYADPLHDPEMFLRFIPTRFVALLLDGWFSLDHETLNVSWPRWVFIGTALGALLLVVVAVRPMLADLDDELRRRARWLLLGSVLGLIPMLPVVPTPRLLGVSLIGIAAVVGLVLDRAWFQVSRRPRGRLAQLASLAVLALAFAHLVHGPATSWLIASSYWDFNHTYTRNQRALRARLGAIATQDLVVVRASARAPLFLPFALDPQHQLPAHFAILAQTNHALCVRRGPRSIELTAASGETLFPLGEANLFIDLRTWFTVGQVFSLPRARATVVELKHGLPRIVRFDFDHDLDASPLVWVSETREGYIDARPPLDGMGMPFDQ